MKNIPTVIYWLSFSFLLNLPSYGGTVGGWSQKYEPQKAFIENKGQSMLKESPGFDPKVLYDFDGDGQRFHITKSGVVFELTDIEKLKEPKNKEHQEREMKERSKKGPTNANPPGLSLPGFIWTMSSLQV